MDQEPRPIAVQIWDDDAVVLAEAAHTLASVHKVSIIDLNFGCPVRKILQSGSGSHLLEFPERVGRIVQMVVRACAPTPVTAKIRLGRKKGRITAFEVARAIEEAGAAALTVHGRLAEDFFKGKADWESIAGLKERAGQMPVIGNGDLDSPRKVVEAFAKYGVDGVMIGRAGLKKPWLFAQAAAALRQEPIPPDPSLERQRELLLLHHRWMVEVFGERDGNVLMRKFAGNYAHGWRGAAEFRFEINRCRTDQEFQEAVDRFFPRPTVQGSEC
jgi:tRNA-dihydrouridine synthase B